MKLEIVRGTTNKFAIMLEQDGNPYVLADNETIVFGIKRHCFDNEACVVKVVGGESFPLGVYYFELTPNDTINLRCGSYFYDVNIRAGEEYDNLIKPSPFKILPNATRWSDGA